MSQPISGVPILLESKIEDILPSFDDNMFDACLCDPPYGLKFMSKSWDHGVPSSEIWAEVLRVLKPGAFLMAFGGTRTYHRLAVAIEDAGFEIRDCLMWMHGQGLPKSLGISKAIDKEAGEERTVVGEKVSPDGIAYSKRRPNTEKTYDETLAQNSTSGKTYHNSMITAPATKLAGSFDGYGTALKPAYEPIILAMKPCEGTFAQNAMVHGVAGINVDGGRVSTSDSLGGGAEKTVAVEGKHEGWQRPWMRDSEAVAAHTARVRENVQHAQSLGRWPANVILSHHSSCLDSECHLLCPVRLLDEQTGYLHGSGNVSDKGDGADSKYDASSYNISYKGRADRDYGSSGGGASRFFYTAKVSTRERNLGGIDCKHPTLKPISITFYLATLLLPPARSNSFSSSPFSSSPRQLLVPFSGAGSEVIGGLLAGWDMVYGIEMESEYVTWAEARVQAAIRGELESGFNPKPRSRPAQASPSLPSVDLDSMLKRQL